MVAPAVAAAGISAAGSLLGGVLGGKGAKKAAKIQLQGTREQIAATERNRDYQYGLNAPTIDLGRGADQTIAGLLNIGGSPSASSAALDAWRASTGYQDLLNTGLRSVNANAYASGMGDSGAALKALQDRGTNIANQSFQGYLGNLTDVANRGAQARGLVAGIGTNSTNSINQAVQTGSDARSNAALIGGANWSQAIQGLFNAGASALGSSYGGGGEPGYYGVGGRGGGWLPGIY